MTAVCQNPECKKDIADGARLLSIGLSINWGTDDLRNVWHGHYAFCSFGCLSAWASRRSTDHDGHVLTEGR